MVQGRSLVLCIGVLSLTMTKCEVGEKREDIFYLLVSQPRSGSTWVGSKIATHPCTFWRGENGHGVWGTRVAKNAKKGNEPCIKSKHPKDCFMDYFKKAGISKQANLVDDVVCPANTSRVLGGKVWGTGMLNKQQQGQSAMPNSMREFLRNHNVRIIWVNRMNVLDREISQAYIKATNTGNVMHCFVGGEKYRESMKMNKEEEKHQKNSKEIRQARNPCLDESNLQVRIDARSVAHHAEQAQEAFNRMGAVLGLTGTDQASVQQTTAAGFPVLYLPCETLVQQESEWLTVAEFLSFPKTDATKYFQDRTIKRVRRSQKEMISNYQEVARDLTRRNLTYLLTA